jgi:hypothetical protein
MNHDEQDQLWDLLGKAKEKKASPFFANKVMCAIRKDAKGLLTRQEPRFSIGAWLRRWWVLPVTGAACAVLAAVALMKDPVTPQQPTAPKKAKADLLKEMVTVISASQDEFDTSLSDLLATEDHTVWLAADPSSLY